MLNMRNLGLWALASLVAVASIGQSHAAEPAVIKSNGTHVLNRNPTELKLSIELLGRGKTLKEALSKLKEKQTAAQDMVQSLGAEMESLTLDAPTTTSRSSEMMEKMREVIQQRVRNSGGPTPEGLKVQDSLTVSSKLHVSWKLEGEDVIARLSEVTALKKKIEESDIASVEGEEIPLAEQELMEEAEAFGYNSFSSGEEVKPGTPQFSYRTSITPQERREALKTAFATARNNAEVLAAAAGMKVTGLKSMEAGGTAVFANMQNYYRYGGGYREESDAEVEADPLQAASPKYAEIPFVFVISAQFNVEPADSDSK
ncbi:SIMPL domain-containing protein [Blastopirellula sp. J2-11]|uniref:SIMPL domain-containing protein n=1 Tax=Blastopirellula sp. J2-11 TaxID=2943192 RepID=UPI0021C666BB|nr:SIMPL domain-containing protein [Blastopirellula sp. J2-11]UUO04352.1 SIMPL domain-containing protein [Blastopirellula sp. J2-11]